MRLKEVIDITGLARSTIYRFMGKGKFPRSIPLGERSVGWLDTEVNEWLSNKVACRDKSSKSD
jgi:prophage regulatory protein